MLYISPQAGCSFSSPRENAMYDNNLDEPDNYELREIARHPLNQRLNRELLDCFRRNSTIKTRIVDHHKTIETFAEHNT